MESIFTIKNEDLDRLTDEEAVESFRDLLHAEARKIGIPLNLINISSRTKVGDGGIDASVDYSAISSGLVKNGKTSYQIKTGKTFNPKQQAQIKKELFDKKQVSKENLGSEIRKCLDSNGTYILVCFGQDFTDKEKQTVESNITNFLEQCGYKDCKVEAWGQNQLQAFFYTFPALALQLTGRRDLTFQSHRSWSENKDMQPNFEGGAGQEQFIEILRNELKENKEFFQLRIKGEPGIGKTKTVLEATKTQDIAPLIIYCNADVFENSPLMYELLREDNSFWAILVLDDCDENRREKIWNKLQSKSNRIKIVTITNEFVKTSPDVGDLEVLFLGSKELSVIIESYGVPKHIAEIWAIECQGFPRVAHVIGLNLVVNPDDPHRSPEIDKIWDKFIAGLQDKESREVKERITVLRHLALFRKFGSPLSKLGVPVISDESKTIANLVREKAGISETRFKEIIKVLKERKILQGEHTLYITPKLLHIKLWSDYWETYGEIEDIEQFAKNLPIALFEWFQEMFEYAQSSPAATQIVEKLLGPNGIYRDISFLNSKTGADFFLTLSKASPKPAIRCLERLIDEQSKEKLLAFDKGRRQIVWALERMAEWKDLFSDAARILLRLGEAETESYSNNASGIFVDLFSNAYGEVAPSEAAPEDKIPILREAFNSSSKERRALAIKACDKALEIDHFSRMHGTHSETFHRSPNRWIPKTWDEWFDAYRSIWNLVLEVINSLPEDERKEAAGVLLRNSFGVGKAPALVEMAISTIRDLLDNTYLEKNDVLENLTEFLWRDNERKKRGMPAMDAGVKQKWEEFSKEIAPKDFSSLLQRYIAIDIHVEKYSEETGFATDLTKPIIEDLAQQALKNPEILEPEFDWLITEKAKRAYDLGYELGRADEEFSFLVKLIEIYITNDKRENLSPALLGGYLRALREKSEIGWENILDNLADITKIKRFIPSLTQASGLTERGAIRIVDLFQKGEITFWELNRFQFGLQVQILSENTLKKWIEFLLSQTDAYAVNIALNYLHQYYVHDSSSKNKKLKLPKNLAFKALTHKTIFDPYQAERFDQMGTFYWKLVAGKYINLFPNKSLKFAEFLIKNFGKDGCLNRGSDEAPKSVLNAVARKFPVELWKITSKFIKFPMDKRVMRIKFWLDDGNLHFGKDIDNENCAVPFEDLWEWIDADVEKRAWFVAWFVPKNIRYSENDSPVAREILIRYGERDDVRRNLAANFGTTGVITGHFSNYYQNRLQEFVSIREKEDNPKVLKWIDDYIERLTLDMESSRIEEEREF